jgi:hypothetical protein
VPPRFAAIVERALARDPRDRFDSAEQMGRVIANLLRTTEERPDARLLGQSVRDVRAYLTTGELPG